jgi:hypothetical protein
VGEIKSTLDLILEKTRNMSLSEEEKEELKTKELVARLRGLVQKALDGALSVSHLRLEIESERKKSPNTDHQLMAALVARIEPDGENERLFQIMEEVPRRNSAPFRKLVLECRQDVEHLKDRSVEDLGKALKERGINGSAVLPNPALYPAWQSASEERITACRRQLDAIADTRTTPARSSENSP